MSANTYKRCFICGAAAIGTFLLLQNDWKIFVGIFLLLWADNVAKQ